MVTEVTVLSLAVVWMIRRLVSPFAFIWNPLVIPAALVGAIGCLQYVLNWTATPYQDPLEKR